MIRTSAWLTLVLGLSSLTLQAHAAPLIKVDGSSTVFPITEAMAEEYQASKKGEVQVTVGISGTGGGFKKFCRGETDIQDASRPISKEEMATCKTAGIEYIELPVGYDALTVVVSKKNDFAKDITVSELKTLWEPAAQGKIKTWKQVRPTWPDTPITLYGAGSDSGTFDYFTEAVVGKAKSSRGDYTASEDDNVLVQGVAGDKNALGYMPFAYARGNESKLRILPIIHLKGPVLPSEKAVRDGTYTPLSRPIFIYVSAKALARPEVREFAQFYLKNSEKLVPEVKYIALPAKAYTFGLEHLAKGKKGTVFGGEAKVGMKIEALMKLEAKDN
jgi:phosphate transport system substrate-binding protein